MAVATSPSTSPSTGPDLGVARAEGGRVSDDHEGPGRDGAGPGQRAFGATLSARVREGLDDDTLRRAYRRLHRKAAFIVVWYAASYLLVLSADTWLVGGFACVSLALSMVAVGFNIQHDANHNAFFATGGTKRLTSANRLAGLSLNSIGGSQKRWIDGHVQLHHSSPNVVGRDYDINLGPLARMAPQQPRRSWHRWQHLYLWFVYGFTAVGIILGDIANNVLELFTKDRHGGAPSVRDHLAMAFSKVIFLLAMVAVPLMFHSWQSVLLGSAIVMAVAGFLLGVVFQLAHVVEEAEFTSMDDRAPARWHEWQVRSSVDFCCGDGPVAKLVTLSIGGLNHQTEHHLLPGLPHTAYPVIAPIVAETCEEFGVRYHVQPTLRAAVRSHYRHLRTLGRA